MESIGIGWVLAAVVVGVLVGTVAALAIARRLAGPDEAPAQDPAALVAELRRQVEDASRIATGEAMERLVATTQQQLTVQQQAVEERTRAAQDGVRDLLAPLQKDLTQLGAHVRELEEKRATAYTDLSRRLQSTDEVLTLLRTTTTDLNAAMRRSDVRGHWGELQLRRVIELAGLKEHVSYSQQTEQVGEGRGRPDVTIHLADGKVLYVDAKAPMAAFFDAVAEQERDRQQPHLARHAADLLGHVKELTKRAYVDDGASVPFMVLFVPNEASLAAALEADPALLEQAMRQRVAIAGPTSLVMILTNVSASWRQQAMADNAADIVKQVEELHRRFLKFNEKLGTLGKRIEATVRAYDDAVGSWTTRLVPRARDIGRLAAIPDEVPEVPAVGELPAVERLGLALPEGSDETTGSGSLFADDRPNA